MMFPRASIIRPLLARGRSSNGSTKEVWSGIVATDKAGRGIDKVAREAGIAEMIRKNTEITRDHMTPELRLHLLTPNCPLYHAPVPNKDLDDCNTLVEPFWSIYWPGGQALTRFILDEGDKIFPRSRRKQRNVLDLGAGCGASAIAAKRIGAGKVLANDIDRVACVAILMNAILNDVDVEVSQENLLARSRMEETYDVILVGDLLYDECVAGVLLPWIEEARKNGATVYLGDPGRHGLTAGLRGRLRLIREYALPENVRRENHGYDKASVWKFDG